MLNTNLCSDIVGNEEDPAGQWAWLDDTLQKSQRNRETVNWLSVCEILCYGALANSIIQKSEIDVHKPYAFQHQTSRLSSGLSVKFTPGNSRV